MKRYFSFFFAATLTLGVLAGLLISPSEAYQSAKSSLALCAGTIVPSLFPFMVVSNMILRLGLAERLGRAFEPLARRLFRVSGAGATVFVLSLAGGYPLGALTVSELYSGGRITRSEAGRLLRFCDNCGPAFIVSVAGSCVFGSARVGFFLYGVHALSAVLVGTISRRGTADATGTPRIKGQSLSAAFTGSVSRASLTCLSVCGFITFFGVCIGLLDAWNFLPSLCGRIAFKTGAELHFIRSLLCGFLEIGVGTGSMLGLSLSAENLALCSFVLGWGGLSVQAQAASAISEGGLPPMPHLLGKLLHGGLSALITFIIYPLFF